MIHEPLLLLNYPSCLVMTGQGQPIWSSHHSPARFQTKMNIFLCELLAWLYAFISQSKKHIYLGDAKMIQEPILLSNYPSCLAMTWQCLPIQALHSLTMHQIHCLPPPPPPPPPTHTPHHHHPIAWFMGPIWGRQDPGGPHVGPMNFAIWAMITWQYCFEYLLSYSNDKVKLDLIIFREVIIWIMTLFPVI